MFRSTQEQPEADIRISPGTTHTTGYQDGDVYIATAPVAGSAATLNIVPELQAGPIRPGEGYLFYQMIALDENGIPDPNITPNTWEPLTIGNTMLASDIWNAVMGNATDEQIASTLKPLVAQLGLDPTVLDDAAIAGLVRAQMLPDLLSNYLKVEFIQEPVNMFLSSLGIGNFQLNDSQTQLIIDLIGGTVDVINELVPVTFESGKSVVMPIQGKGMSLLVGDYGIRAMGIDSLFNVGGHVAPTHLRIVEPSTNIDRATITVTQAHGDFNDDGILDPVYKTDIIYRNSGSVMISGTVENLMHPLESVMLQYMDASGNWAGIGEATVMGADFEGTWNVTDFGALIGAGDSVKVRAIATNVLQLKDENPPTEYEYTIALDGGIYPPEVLDIVVDEASMTNPDSGAPQGVVNIKAYTLSQTGPETVKVRFELTQSDGTTVPLGTAEQGVTPTGLADAVQAAVGSAAAGTDASVNPGDYHEWTLTIDTTTLADTITKDGAGARDVSKDDNQHTIRAFAVSADATEWPSDAMTMLSVDNVDDVGPLGPTYITTIANAGGMVEADTHRGLVDENDPSVVPQSVTLTIEPDAVRKTYTSVMLVSDPEINAGLIGDITETSEGSGVFTVTVDIGGLGIEGNGTYKLHALVDDEPKNGQAGEESPARTVEVKNYERPDPAVFKLTVDDDTETKNADSGGPQGTFMFTGYTIEQNSPPIESIRLEAKRANDTDWTTIGTGDAGTSIDIEDAALTDTLDHLVGIAVAGTETGDKSVVAIDATNKQWAVSVDTVALKLEDTIKKGSDAARDASKDDNPYTVRAFAVDGSGKEWGL